MRSRAVRFLITAALITAALVAGTTVPIAAVSAAPVTWTRITSPSSDYTATKTTFVVSGKTSSDVANVDIDCVWENSLSGQQQIDSLVKNVPVTSGTFSAVAQTGPVGSTCRLHAVPSGSSTAAGYFAAFAGPVLHLRLFLRIGSGAHAPQWSAGDTRGDGVAVYADDGSCPNAAATTVSGASLSAPEALSCAFALTPENTGSDPSTGSSITVDGHNAYLPSGTSTLLAGELDLTVTPAPLTTKAITARNGDLTVTESADLQRCSVDDTYPPTKTSCPKLVSTGVTFTRVVTLTSGSHEVGLRDAFTSTGNKHTVLVAYQNGVDVTPGGPTDPGFVIPGKGGSFVAPPAGKSVTGLGTKAASVLVRSDRYAAADDPQADSHAFTWSKAPSKIRFEKNTASLFAMDYSLAVPAHGSSYLGFAFSEGPTTAALKSLAASTVSDMVSAPTIASPSTGASIKGKTTVVTGSVSLGANGLPKSVSVNGHHAELTATSATKATWKVSFAEGYGAHVLKVVATDNAGNTATKSIKVKNSP